MSPHLDCNRKPYAVAGAGHLISSIWKRGNQRIGWQMRFEIHRLNGGSGRASRLLHPADIVDLARLCQVLAAMLVDDGCISNDERQQLAELARNLDAITKGEP